MTTRDAHLDGTRAIGASDGLGQRLTRRELLQRGAAAGALLAVGTACDPLLLEQSSTTTTTAPSGPAPCAFRNSLSVSPFAELMFVLGLRFSAGDHSAKDVRQLQELFNAYGATEMSAMIGTRKVTGTTDGGAEMGWARGIERAALAAALGMPINPVLGGFATYADSMQYQQAPDFRDYPGIELPGPWFTLRIDQMANALRAYGKAVAGQILATGVQVDHWDLGNEVDFGFAGVTVQPLFPTLYTAPDAVDPAIGSMSTAELIMISEQDRIAWCRTHLWPHVGTLLAALRDGIRQVDPSARFSTHIAGLGARSVAGWTAFWDAVNEGGYLPDTFGASLYPSAAAPFPASTQLGPVADVASALFRQYGRQTFVAECGYPSAEMTGTTLFNTPLPGYPIDPVGQARYFHDLIATGLGEGWLSGVRPWAPDLAFGQWAPMSFFDLTGTNATAKPALDATHRCVVS